VPESGWVDAGYDGVLEPSGRLALGYACPAAAAEPPVAVEDVGRVAADPEPSVDAETAVRRLGRASPPRDAVPAVDDELQIHGGPVSADERPVDESADGPQELPPWERHAGSADEGPADPGGERDGRPAGEGGERDGRPAGEGGANRLGNPTDRAGGDPNASAAGLQVGIDGLDRDDPALPPALEAWLDEAERRVERGERLSAGSLSEATAVLTEAGGVDAVADLPDRLARDARTLRALARRASVLATRAEAVDVPVESLRRLA
jgi:hypothetical protein